MTSAKQRKELFGGSFLSSMGGKDSDVELQIPVKDDEKIQLRS